jgi:hypothetical protein
MARRFVEPAIFLLLLCPALLPAAPDSPGTPPLVLSFVGDIMHHRENAEMPDYDRLYDAVREALRSDDLSFANVEFPVDPSHPPAGYPLFNGSAEYLRAAVRGGIDVLSLANNHTFEMGASGVRATLETVEALAAAAGPATAVVAANGIRRSADEPIELTTIERRGWRIGFVSVTSFSNVPGSSAYINLVDYSDDGVRSSFLDLVRRWSSEVDVLVVGVHAGVEYATSPAAGKVAFFRDLADAGADIVWGHHPHVLQPWERRGGALIIYSAGNFVSAQRRHQSPSVPAGRWAPTGDTAIYRVRVERGATGIRVTSVETPLYTVFNHPEDGLVVRSFDEVLVAPQALEWRAFYFARYAVMRRFMHGAGTLRSMSISRPRSADAAPP